MKKELIQELKILLKKLLLMTCMTMGFFLILMGYLHAIFYLFEQFPDYKQRINDLGLCGLGFIAITYLRQMIKIMDKTDRSIK